MTGKGQDWTVRDIRTGRAVAKTQVTFELMFNQLQRLQIEGLPSYFAIGAIRHNDFRSTVNLLREHGYTVVRDRQLPPDMLLLFEGTPDKLGFAV